MPRSRTLWALAALAGGGLIVAAAVWVPGHAARAALRAECDAAHAAVTRVPALTAQIDALHAELDAVPDAAGGPAGGEESGGGPRATLARLAGCAAGCGVDLSRLSPRPAEEAGTYRTWPFEVSFEAPFPAAVRFLAQLEEGRPAAEVTALTLTALPRGTPGGSGEGGDPDAPTRLRGTLEVVVYEMTAGPADDDA